MLNQIRNLSKHPAILVMMGMLIFVFVLFFGLPGQGGGAEQNVFSQWSAKVGDETLEVSEAMLYARRRARRNDEMQTLRGRVDEIVNEELVDQAAAKMGWVSTYEQERAYIASAANHDLVYFGNDTRRTSDVHKDFLASLPEGSKPEDMSSADLIEAYLAYSKKMGGFSAERFQDFISSWGLNVDQYIASKGRELRVRGYLSFLNPTLKVSDRQSREALNRAEESWSFKAVSVGANNVAPSAEAPSAETVASYVKDKQDRIGKYYKAHIEDYSKSVMKFTKVSARYTGESQQKEAEAKINEARKRILAGEDPEAVASALSTSELSVSAFVMSNKSRKNTSEKLFNTLFAMESGEMTEVEHAARPQFNFPGMAPQPKGGTYSFARLEELTKGEEKSVKDVEADIAKLLIDEDGRATRAQSLASKLHGLLKAGKGLDEAAAEASEAGAQSALVVSETGDLKIDALLDGNVEGIGRDAEAGELIAAELFKVSAEAPLISAPVKVGEQWVVLSLRERSTPSDDSFAMRRDALSYESQKARVGAFFGSYWLQFALLSPAPAPGMPREVYNALQDDFAGVGRDAFLDRVIASNYFQRIVTRNPSLNRFFEAK